MSGARIQMGNSYTYTAPPTAPDQRLFTVALSGMQYFVDTNGAIDLVTDLSRNMAHLDSFYNDHKLYLSFDFNHPIYGLVKCKFNRPLEIPNGVQGGNGLVEGFSLELIEMP
jgi:hypothetical protein